MAYVGMNLACRDIYKYVGKKAFNASRVSDSKMEKTNNETAARRAVLIL
jgi:hypothetical protein